MSRRRWKLPLAGMVLIGLGVLVGGLVGLTLLGGGALAVAPTAIRSARRRAQAGRKVQKVTAGEVNRNDQVLTAKGWRTVVGRKVAGRVVKLRAKRGNGFGRTWQFDLDEQVHVIRAEWGK